MAPIVKELMGPAGDNDIGIREYFVRRAEQPQIVRHGLTRGTLQRIHKADQCIPDNPRMVQRSPGHRMHFAVQILTAKLGVALDFEVLIDGEPRHGFPFGYFSSMIFLRRSAS